jgi:UDP-N-acetylmuramate--alanine ligase
MVSVSEKLPDRLHFIGIGGAGMAPLAAILRERGKQLSGSDLIANSLTAELARSGVKIFLGHQAENVPDDTEMIVYSSAVKSDNPEMSKAKELGIPALRRGELLGRLAAEYRRPVAVSGSHGKTTVTAMLVHILLQCQIPCGYMIGGKLSDNTPSALAGNGDIFITEVDESDGTHTLINPYLGVVPNVEDDHCWSVGGTEKLYENFATFGRNSQKLILLDSELTEKLFSGHADCRFLKEDHFVGSGVLPGLSARLFDEWGSYQLFDAALAVEAAAVLGVERHQASEALNTFGGVARRMTVHKDSADLVIIEDYAHHPTEVRMAIAALRKRYPGQHLRVVFQPHRYARLEKYFDAFAAELAKADSVYIAPVFAAWTETAPCSSEDLAAAIPGGKYINPPWRESGKELLEKPSDKPLLLAIFGAGDIDALITELI